MRFVTFLLLLCSSLSTASSFAQNSAGVVRYVIRTAPYWDQYTKNPSADMQQWFRSNVWRMMVFSPYWDGKNSWYSNTWLYLDLYAIYADKTISKEQQGWILKDHAGKNLYIPWGCHDGTCPQYAANVADPAFRAHWIQSARSVLNKGYKGLWIDDVNLDFQVGDGSGKHVAVVNPLTGKEMSDADWKRSMAEFMEQIRQAFPNIEILHNALWFAGGSERDKNQYIKRELAAADYINLERGVTDGGLRGGSGEWSLNAFFAFIDRLHAMGKAVVLDNMSEIEYSTAAYFLINNGHDAMGDQSLHPDQWWPGLKTNLGQPLGPRESWNGLLRRKFTNGVVLVNPPDAQPVRLRVAGGFRRAVPADAADSFTIPAAKGVVLVGPASGAKADSALQVLK